MTDDEFAGCIVDMTQTLYRICYSQLSQRGDREDAVQECLCKAWEKRQRLCDDSRFKPWIIRILLNECHNIQRRKTRTVPTETLPERAAPIDKNSTLNDVLVSLDEKQRIPILLHYIEGYSVEEIARILRVPTGTVKSRMAHGRDKLRELLHEEVFCNENR